ncbi:MAG TPA: fibronectin type III domain-containing protein [Candidatus Dormibacteraeota bacterium]|nr:fibronectin type III domain-containing protein [Candidatus Dormibacteraeota bacterium]
MKPVPACLRFRRSGVVTFLSYYVLALAGCGGGSGPAPDTIPPTVPSNLAATAASSTQINLTWTASTDDVAVTGYKVERCQGASCTSFAQIAAPTGTTFNDTGLTASTSYSYRVRAADAAGNVSASSTVATATTPALTVAVSLSPKRGGLTVGQPLTLTATLTNDTQVTWSTSSGGSLTGQTNTTTSFSAAAAGVYTITATSVADTSKSATVSVGVTDLTGVFTYHNDLYRDGANTKEYALTTANVNTAMFGKMFSCAVDGAIYAQPLWVANVTIGSVKHNVIIVATQHDSVYAFDADASPCVTLWRFSMLDGAHGGTTGEVPVPSPHTSMLIGSGYGDIEAEVGITGTPAIDAVTNTIYVVSKSVIPSGTPTFFQRLHALDLTTGAEKLNGNKPVLITATVPGDGDGSSGGNVPFNAQTEHQRAGLALVNGIVYVAWASHEDTNPYHGWVIGYRASDLTQVTALNTTPKAIGTITYSRGGIWMGGGALAADVSNNIYFTTGNGTWDGITNFSDSFVRLRTSGGLSVTDWFTPSNQATLDLYDTDLGSGGAVLADLPAAPTSQVVIGGGKEGRIYLLNRGSMGHLTSGDSGVLQSFPASNGIFATPAFWQNKIYFAAATDTLKLFTLDPTLGRFIPLVGPSATSQSVNSFGFPGATPSVSAAGASNGIVWALDNSQYCTQPSTAGCGPAVLHAYDATNLMIELWNSAQAPANRDKAGNAVKFTVPTVANGKVYVGTRGADTVNSGVGELDVYGLLPN